MQRSTRSRLDKDGAETIALQAFAYLAADPQRLARFLSLTGIAPGQLRSEAKTAEFQGAVLDHMMGDESLLLAFCQDAGINPESMRGAHVLITGLPD